MLVNVRFPNALVAPVIVNVLVPVVDGVYTNGRYVVGYDVVKMETGPAIDAVTDVGALVRGCWKLMTILFATPTA